MKYIDCHAHLNDNKLINDINNIISMSINSGCKKIFNNGDSLESFNAILDISKKYPNYCYSVLGIHPEFANKNKEYYINSEKKILENIKDIKAIGEIGLDYHYTKEEEIVKKQKELFINQIRFAKKHDLPIVVHSRDASYDTLKIIKEEKPKKVYLHCFSDSLEIFNQYLKLGIDIKFGVGGVITFKNAKVIKEIVSLNDLKYFLTETDSPYLTPEPYRGKINNPSYIPYVIKEIARLKNKGEEEVAEILYRNGENFYGKD